MSYTVLARKYRPLDFEQMVGQEHVVQALSNALTQQRLHHAYLFTGTRGVGKTTVSRILAKSLNCTGPDGMGGITAHPCGQCAACRDIDSGRFVDYVELDAASNRGVEEISQLLDQAVYKPVVGRFKVYMIDEVHMLSTTAFNAMLKTLEEPPEYLKFVLATTDPQKVPVTVLSRCLQFNLRPMATEVVQEHLQHVLQAEAIPAEPGALRLLARAARGSMRDALSLTDQAIAFGAGQLQEEAVRQMLGAVDRGHVVRIVQALAASDGAGLLAVVDALRGLGLSAAGTLEELAATAQQMAVLQAVPQALDPNDPEAQTQQLLAGLLAPDETQLLYSIAVHGRAELALAPDEYSGLSMVLLRMLAFRPQGAVVNAPQRPVAAPARIAVEGAAGSAAAARSAALRAPAPASRSSAASAAAKDTEIPPWIDAPMATEIMAAEEVPRSVRASSSSAAIAAVPLDAEPETLSSADIALGDRWSALVRSLCEAGAIAALVRELAMQAQ
ncbi:MAG TPA: DNA polymerase III subunit gamma/tau, partial [Methylibium sp.]